MTRWNLMGLAFLLNSGLAHADRITGMSIWRAQPGQVVTLHGQFTVENFRSRQYRIILNKKNSPRAQGAINGVIDSFRVTPTSVMVRIPRAWKGHPVANGEYLLDIKDITHKRLVFNGSSGGSGSLFIESGARTVLGAAKKSIRGQVKRRQQQRLGGNIARAASPRSPFGRGNISGGIAKGAPQMRLTIDHVGDARGHRLSSVTSGAMVKVFFKIQNLGTVPGTVYIRNLRGDRSSNITVGPGQHGTTYILKRVERVEIDRRHTSWSLSFTLYDGASVSRYFNHPYIDSYKPDNTVKISGIEFNWKGDLAIIDIKRVSLKLREGRSLRDTLHSPEAIMIVVSIKNLDATTASSPRRILNVNIEGLRAYIPFQVRNNRQYFPDRLSRALFCNDQKCSRRVGVHIDPILPLQQRDVAIRIEWPLGFTLWDIDGSKLVKIRKQDERRGYYLDISYAGGYYMCPTHAGDREGSRIRIKAEVDTYEDDRTRNNGMIRDVSFGGEGTFVDRCETTNESALTPYTPRSR